MKKKYSFFIFTLFITSVLTAQTGNTCGSAVVINNGVATVNIINGQPASLVCTSSTTSAASNAKWYSYTAAATSTVTVTSNLSQNMGLDTRVHVYSGSCTTLTCVAGSDDVSSNNFASTASFQAVAGQQFLIAWDNRWTSAGFDFEISTSAPAPANEFNFVMSSINTTGDNRAAVDMNNDGLDDTVSISRNNICINYQTPSGFNLVNIPTTNVANQPSWSLAAADFDKNGYTDLLYGGGNGVTFMKANSNGTAFTEVSGSQYVFSQRSNFIDINNDGHLDAFVCHDVAPNVYYLNDGTGNLVFHQGADPNGVPSGLGLITNGGNYGTIWIDYDNDRDMDLFIAKCRGGNTSAKINELHRNNGDGTFTNVAGMPGVNLADPVQTWSTAWADFDNDGDMDVFIGASSFSDGSHKMMRNNGDGTFTDITNAMGSDINQLGTDIENVAGDFNNDGKIDILSDGNIMKNNGDGTFTRISANIPENGAIGDLNNDGYLDVFNATNLYLNSGGANNYLKVKLVGTQSNSNGIGARIEVTSPQNGTQIREIRSGEGFRFMGSLNAHFGMGTDNLVDIRVYWPSGNIDNLTGQNVNGLIIITENSTASIDDNTTNNLSFYPNPVSDMLHLQLDNLETYTSYSIYDVNGRQVIKELLDSIEIKVADLKSGVYFIQLNGMDGILKGTFIKE